MIDEEVESVLREIRERVISQPAESLAPPPSNAVRNGDGNAAPAMSPAPQLRTSEALARLNAHLTTTARAWDRLPPIFSNRRGTAARIELWIKARLKRFSRWFTWEQVNFNSAVHHALGDAGESLGQHDAAIASINLQLAELQSQTNSQQTVQELLRAEIQAQLAMIEAQTAELGSLRAQLQADAAARRLELQAQQKHTNALQAELRGEVEAMRARLETQKQEAAAELSTLSSELRDRADVIENEQRVCYKQLSLELNETAVSRDRAQHQTNAALEEVQERIKKLESPGKRAAKP